MDYTKLYINGDWVEPNSKEFIDVENPATKEIISKVPRSNEIDVNKAIEAAHNAFETWQFTTIEDRTTLVNKLYDELIKRVDIMAETIVKELGCGIKFARNVQVIPYLDDIKKYVKLVNEYKFEEEFENYTVRKEPVGVIGALTPWNYPLGQITKKIIPALLTGNTVVLKPSQNTPLVAYLLTDAIHASGFPEGVFNLVTGKGSEVGDLIAQHKDVNMISFTGSTMGGIEVGKVALNDVKKLALELGGKSPSIVLKGADYRLAVQKTLDKVYNNTGQTCSAYSRMIVPKEDKENIENLVVEMTKTYKFGNPKDPETIIGPLVSKKQFEKVKSYIQKGIDEGAKLLIGEIPKDDQDGYFVGPTVFANVDNNMKIARDEIFGPVLSIIPYETEEEAIRIANDTVYGLSGGVFGPEEKALSIAKKIKTGSIVVNEGGFNHQAPFGGFKQSGIGREGGVFGLEEYLEVKAIFK